MQTVVVDQYSIKYRPQSLDDVLGQPRAVRDCKNFISTKKIPACLLISGKTGTGKTTIARILANAINGNGQDIHEYNVSDKRRIEDVREISEKITYKPLGNEKHIIILDEVQQMQKQSASALLKLFEETNTIWILCTDQPNLLLKTIRDRAYKIVLDDVKKESLMELLKRIYQKEMRLILENLELKITDEDVKGLLRNSANQAIDSIATVSEGCPRESLQNLQHYIVSLEHHLRVYKTSGAISHEELDSSLQEIVASRVVGQVATTSSLTAKCTNLAVSYIKYCLYKEEASREECLAALISYTKEALSIGADSIFGIMKFSSSGIEAVIGLVAGHREDLDASEFLALSISKALRELEPSMKMQGAILKYLARYYKFLHKLQLEIANPYFDVAEHAKVAFLDHIHN